MSILVRPYTTEDFDDLLQVQREAFPPPFPEHLWWNKDQIAAHVDTYPAGAMIALYKGQIAGSATSLLVQYTGQPHTWEEVADHGYIRGSHEQTGDSLYGIDLCVSPAFRGKGIAKALYAARKELVRKASLKRFIAACRIPGYHSVAAQMSAEHYVQRVLAGSLHDQVLTFMLKQDMVPLQVLDHYLDDEESCHKAVLLQWSNPHLQEQGDRSADE
ncbi:MAG: hypothetical protein K0R67_1019 [Paenibacillus sp.]|jgi:ribosomal protein S18 acetylase RimI-like enzyme|nr:hypothetical protein [Paenibacillus sp.]